MIAHCVTGGGGTMLHVEEAGNPTGTPILFIHGFSQCGLAFDRQFASPALSGFRLVRMDMRGHGRSDKPEGAYGESRIWAQDVAAAIGELGLERPVLVGWSYGGVVILDHIRRFGTAHLGGIVLVAAVSKVGRTLLPFLGRDFLALVRDFYAEDRAVEEAAMRRFLSICQAAPPPPAELDSFLAYNMDVPVHARRGLFSRSVDNDDLLRRLDLPVSLIYGEKDAIVLPAMGEHHARLIPGARLSAYEGIGHMPFWEDAKRFNAELAAFAGR